MRTLESNSILLNTDSYKVSMWKQYPPGTTHVYSYIEARGGDSDNLVWFGIQAFIDEYLTRPVTKADVEFAKVFWESHGEPFNYKGWMHIVNEHNGFLPIRIRSVPEGSVIPLKNVLATVENTDPDVPWITTWVETALLRAAWYGSTVATVSRNIKEIIYSHMVLSGADLSGLLFKLHDFGARGVSSLESSGIGGAAHLINFMGTDNVSGIFFASKYYGADPLATAYSVPAAEHSTVTSWGREGELDSYRNLIQKHGKPGGIVSVVSDSYDIFEAAKMWVSLKEEIEESGATLVIRPDSGDPVEVLTKLLGILEEGFGVTTSLEGYKLLNGVRLLWGDGIDIDSITRILTALVYFDKWSADNFVFGMGGALLQHPNRDTFKFAMKASAAKIDGIWRDVFKDPITDSGKKSKKGRVTLYKDVNGGYFSSQILRMDDCLKTVFEDGVMHSRITFEEVRKNAAL